MSKNEKENFKDSRYSVPNLERALVIMEYLIDQPKGMGITELTEELQFSKNSVFRITTTLLNHGYLIRDAQKRFRISKKLLAMGCKTIGESHFMEFSLDVMRECRDELKETILIGTMIENQGVVMEQVLGSHPFKFSLDLGMRLPVHCAAPCKAMMAFMPKSEQELILKEAVFTKHNENTITTPAAFLQELRVVKECGYALDRAEQLKGIHCIAAPIFDQYGKPIASIWTTGPSEHLPESNFSEFGEIMKKYAQQISYRMGYKAMEDSPILDDA